MSPPASYINLHLVDAVINSRLSHTVALGKRKASESFASGSSWHSPNHGSSTGTSSDGEDDVFEYEEDGDEDIEECEQEEHLSVESRPPRSETPKGKPYRCIHQGCTKSYTKPSRLAEHQRSHTGERPYVCSTCTKSYLRESHLQAHTRIHLPESARPFACVEDSCTKRFWTVQHLGVHVATVHRKEKAFTCTEDGCNERFGKQNQLRRHFTDVHCPPGTHPYQCMTQGCEKSFTTNQKLRKHSKVHEGNRYACAETGCVSTTGTSSPLYFPTWTALQAHHREHHPPTCPHPECERRVFASQKGLKGHLKVHEEREIEESLEKAAGNDHRPMKRRRGGEVGRDWACEVEGCVKTFKSKKALTTHHNITHLGRRDHACSYPNCGQAFGYKHLLQRHTAKTHPNPTTGPTSSSASASVEDNGQTSSNIGWITGANYTLPSAHRNTRRPLVPCPWPDSFGQEDVGRDGTDLERCSYVFNRAYDLRRHLKTDHGLELTKEEMDGWVRDWRERHS